MIDTEQLVTGAQNVTEVKEAPKPEAEIFVTSHKCFLCEKYFTMIGTFKKHLQTCHNFKTGGDDDLRAIEIVDLVSSDDENEEHQSADDDGEPMEDDDQEEEEDADADQKDDANLEDVANQDQPEGEDLPEEAEASGNDATPSGSRRRKLNATPDSGMQHREKSKKIRRTVDEDVARSERIENDGQDIVETRQCRVVLTDIKKAAENVSKANENFGIIRQLLRTNGMHCCSFCGLFDYDRDLVARHQREKHFRGWLTSNFAEFDECGICGAEFWSAVELESHLVDAHPKLMPDELFEDQGQAFDESEFEFCCKKVFIRIVAIAI